MTWTSSGSDGCIRSAGRRKRTLADGDHDSEGTGWRNLSDNPHRRLFGGARGTDGSGNLNAGFNREHAGSRADCAPSSIDQVMGQGDPKHSPALALLDAIARSYGGSPWWIR